MINDLIRRDLELLVAGKSPHGDGLKALAAGVLAALDQIQRLRDVPPVLPMDEPISALGAERPPWPFGLPSVATTTPTSTPPPPAEGDR